MSNLSLNFGRKKQEFRKGLTVNVMDFGARIVADLWLRYYSSLSLQQPYLHLLSRFMIFTKHSFNCIRNLFDNQNIIIQH